MSEPAGGAGAPPKAYRRLVVGFDHHVESRSVLDVAARVAAAGELELAGVFVEDTDLLGIAGLPFSTEFLSGTRRSRSLDLASVERELRTQIGATEQALRDAAMRARRAFSFRTVRGRLVRTLIAQATAGDLIMLRRADQPWTVPAGIMQLVSDGPVAVVDPGADAHGDIMQLAAELAADLGQDLCVVHGTAPQDIERGARAAGAGLIVLPIGLLSTPDWRHGFEGFADRVPCAVLIASAPDASA